MQIETLSPSRPLCGNKQKRGREQFRSNLVCSQSPDLGFKKAVIDNCMGAALGLGLAATG